MMLGGAALAPFVLHVTLLAPVTRPFAAFSCGFADCNYHTALLHLAFNSCSFSFQLSFSFSFLFSATVLIVLFI